MIGTILIVASLIGAVLGFGWASERAKFDQWMRENECHYVEVQPDWISCKYPTPGIYKEVD